VFQASFSSRANAAFPPPKSADGSSRHIVTVVLFIKLRSLLAFLCRPRAEQGER